MTWLRRLWAWWTRPPGGAAGGHARHGPRGGSEPGGPGPVPGHPGGHARGPAPGAHGPRGQDDG